MVNIIRKLYEGWQINRQISDADRRESGKSAQTPSVPYSLKLSHKRGVYGSSDKRHTMAFGKHLGRPGVCRQHSTIASQTRGCALQMSSQYIVKCQVSIVIRIRDMTTNSYVDKQDPDMLAAYHWN